MEAKHRYRLLIYFAALILCLSVCFANAEETSAAAPVSQHSSMIFETSHGHAAFMPALQQSFVAPQAAAAPEEHVVPASVLQQVTETNRSHRFWHGAARHRTSLVLIHQVSASTPVATSNAGYASAGQSE